MFPLQAALGIDFPAGLSQYPLAETADPLQEIPSILQWGWETAVSPKAHYPLAITLSC